MSESGRLSGRLAIVTGGAAGIGLATAKEYVAAGATTVIVDIDGDRARARAEEIGAEAFAVDLTQEKEVERFVAAVIADHGKIDALVNLAGFYGPRPLIEEQTLPEFRAVIAANLESAFLCCRQVVPHMRERGYGRIVNTASGTFHNPQPGLSAYVGSKGGVIGFTRVLAKEVGGDGITVNVVMPGMIETEHVLTMLGDTPEGRETVAGFFERTIEHQSVKRRGKPEDLAHAILFLTDERAGFITGQSLQLDGGSTFV
ncbi:MAG: SDR family oxidoreductase [Actinobacteria bacterium]|nr:SDR family oxidoreductase [Actinomycetota bacterium]